MLSVFDLDHTLLNINSSMRYYFFLRNFGVFAWRSIFISGKYWLLYQFYQLSPRDLHNHIFNLLLKGLPKEQIFSFVEEFAYEVSSCCYYLPAIRCLEEAKKRGDYILLLSNSPSYLVEPFAKALGVHEYRATEYCLDNDKKLSSVKRFMDGSEKAVVTMEVAKRLSISKEQITGYSDSVWDLPLLENCGNVIGVCPDRKLKNVCLEKGWRII